MKPDHNDLRSASFLLELLTVTDADEHLDTIAQAFAGHRVVVREHVLSLIEAFARDQKMKAVKLRAVVIQPRDFHDGLAQGMEIVLIGLRQVIRDTRGIS